MEGGPSLNGGSDSVEVVREHELRAAGGTLKPNGAQRFTRLLECRALGVIEAVAAVLMRGLRRGHAFLWQIGKHPCPNLTAFVALSLCVPILQAHTLLFQLSVAVKKRRFFRMHGHRPGDGIEKLFLQLCDLGSEFSKSLQRAHSPRDRDRA